MQTHHKLMIMAIIFSLILLALGQKCHAEQLLDDFAGLRKSVNQGPIWAPDPSRLFATPGGGGHPEGSTVAMPTAKAEQAAKPEVKPEAKPEPKPPCPKPPIVKPPKDEPVKPEAKEHKCWPFKFRPVKHDCTPKVKPEHKAKPDCKHAHDKPACKADRQDTGHKSECSKPAGDKPSCKPSGMHGRGFGIGRHGHGVGKGAGHGHGKGCGRG